MCYAKFKSEDFSITVRKYEGNQYIMVFETGGKRVIAKATQQASESSEQKSGFSNPSPVLFLLDIGLEDLALIQ